jgi:hypothetical protein
VSLDYTGVIKNLAGEKHKSSHYGFLEATKLLTLCVEGNDIENIKSPDYVVDGSELA